VSALEEILMRSAGRLTVSWRARVQTRSMSETSSTFPGGAAPDWTGALLCLACAALALLCLSVARVAGRVPSFEASVAMVLAAIFLPLGVAGLWTALIRSMRRRRGSRSPR